MLKKEGLIPGDVPKDMEPTFSEKCAARLSNLVKKNKLQVGRMSFKKWADEFTKLQKKHDDATITKVMDWYVLNIGKEYVPEAYSAMSFRKKFDQIKKQVEDTPIGVGELSLREKKLFDRVKNWQWGGWDRYIPMVIKNSLTRYLSFRSKMVMLPDKLKEKAKQSNRGSRLLRLSRIVEHLLSSGKLGSPEPFLMNWLEHFQTIISKGYEVSANRMVWGMNNPTYLKIIHNAVYDYCHSSLVWDEIAKELET